MQYREYFGQGYTEFFAWWPRRMTSGRWIWLDTFYLRPDRNGQGILLSFSELLMDHD